MDGPGGSGLGDADIFWLQLSEIDSSYRLAVDDEEDTVPSKEIGQDNGGFAALDYGVDGVDDGFKTAEALDLLDDGGDRRVVSGGAASDGRGDTGQNTGAGEGAMDKDTHGGGAQDERKEDREKGAGGAASGGVLSGHAWVGCSLLWARLVLPS